MSKLRATLLALICLLLGLFAGGWAVAHVAERLSSDLRVWSCIRESQSMMITLKKLRAGDPNSAMQLLELELDGALSLLGSVAPVTPLDPMQKHVLLTIRDYRTTYPRPARWPTADAIANAFKLADEPSAR